MSWTVHETPVIRTLMRLLAMAFFYGMGWRTEGRKPEPLKYVVIAAPHTSNWDFIYTLCACFIFRVCPMMMMKKTWFHWSIGWFFRWLGAIPVDRSKSNGVVVQSIQAFQEADQMVLMVPPSGTRKKVLYWKTGFYHIAVGARVPIVLGFLDYRRKIAGLGPGIDPTGDIDVDMVEIRKFYSDVTGRYPEMASSLLNPIDAETLGLRPPMLD
jgi:1-acyl-sn-glycerol-3-phosphate acyltransferase